jgi:hypothetical protein
VEVLQSVRLSSPCQLPHPLNPWPQAIQPSLPLIAATIEAERLGQPAHSVLYAGQVEKSRHRVANALNFISSDRAKVVPSVLDDVLTIDGAQARPPATLLAHAGVHVGAAVAGTVIAIFSAHEIVAVPLYP